MNRTRARWGIGLGLAVIVWVAFDRLATSATPVLSFGAAVLGAIGVFVMRDVFIAREKLRQRAFDEAFVLFERFEKEQLASSWRRVVSFMFVGVDSTNGVAVARNGMGSVRLEQRRLDEAERFFRSALERDAQYSLPYANLAILAALRGDVTTSKTELERAVSLGGSRKRIERAIQLSTSGVG